MSIEMKYREALGQTITDTAGKSPAADAFHACAGLGRVLDLLCDQIDRVAAIRRDPYLSDAGKADKVAGVLGPLQRSWSNWSSELRRASEGIGAAIDVSPKIEPRAGTDIAGALFDSELRAMLRSAPPEQRVALAIGDERTTLAALRAPRAVSALSDPDHLRVRTAWLKVYPSPEMRSGAAVTVLARDAVYDVIKVRDALRGTTGQLCDWLSLDARAVEPIGNALGKLGFRDVSSSCSNASERIEGESVAD